MRQKDQRELNLGTGAKGEALKTAAQEIEARAAKASLDCGKELDEQFNDFLHEAVYYSNPKILHQLYRSRFRLLRGFSGLWLIYDRGGQPAGV